MKIERILIPILLFALSYLLGSFVQFTFNPELWGADARAIVIICWATLTAIYVFVRVISKRRYKMGGRGVSSIRRKI